MKSLKKLLNNYAWFILLALLTVGCKEEEKPEAYVAQVGGEVLTESRLEEELAEVENSAMYREEYIRNWIESEMLYQEAVDEGILDSDEYRKITAGSEKRLAAAIYVKKYFEESPVKYFEADLEEYYNNKPEDFLTPSSGVVLNLISFEDIERAVLFRSKAVNDGWLSAVQTFGSDNNVSRQYGKRLLYDYQLQPQNLKRVINNLAENEVSIVVETEPQLFTIVQVVGRIKRNEVPPYEFVKNEVKKRYMLFKQRELFKEHLNKLYSNYDVEISKEFK